MINFVLRIPKFPGSISSLNRNTLLKQKLKQWWQWCLVKIEFIFYLQFLQLSRSVQCTYGFKNYLRLKCVQCYYNNYSKQKYENSATYIGMPFLTTQHSIILYSFVFFARMAMKCTGTKIYTTNVPPMFWSFDLLFSDNLSAVVSVVCMSSLNNTYYWDSNCILESLKSRLFCQISACYILHVQVTHVYTMWIAIIT